MHGNPRKILNLEVLFAIKNYIARYKPIGVQI